MNKTIRKLTVETEAVGFKKRIVKVKCMQCDVENNVVSWLLY